MTKKRMYVWTCKKCGDRWSVPIGSGDHGQPDERGQTICGKCADHMVAAVMARLGKRIPKAATVVQ